MPENEPRKERETGSENGPITVFAIPGIGEVTTGVNLADLIRGQVVDGDIVVITSKIVSKAEGRFFVGEKSDAVAQETVRTVAQRGGTRIARNRLGLTMAGAGVDASNVEQGKLLLLPEYPDRTAAKVRTELAAGGDANVAVIVSDTSGRAWRTGQTDIAIGAAGLRVELDYDGITDGYGNTLAVTLTAVADELAAAGDLVKGKLSGCPVAVIRGLSQHVLQPGENGPGATTLIRDERSDLFGLGAREAVMAALLRTDSRGFGAPAPAETVVSALASLGLDARIDPSDSAGSATDFTAGGSILATDDERTLVVAYAHGWRAVAGESVTSRDGQPGRTRLLPGDIPPIP
ncbi:MAG: coenzyme F420-0:L-glutamate ligase [Nocardioidaceae bacterium]|nr:MAG: coenzyme F420-0:L-glutamate ligase [Nocardioidaceae bacterium]